MPSDDSYQPAHLLSQISVFGCTHRVAVRNSFLHNGGSSGVLLIAKYLEAAAISLYFKIILKYILTNSTVEKDTPCKVTFVYTSYIRYGIRAASKFG